MTRVSARVSTMVNAVPFSGEGWHAPAGRRTCEPRPLIQARQIRPAAPVGARNLGPGRQIVSQDSPSGVSRIGGQAGTQASDPTPAPPQNRASRAGSTIHSLPAEYLRDSCRRLEHVLARRSPRSGCRPANLRFSSILIVVSARARWPSKVMREAWPGLRGVTFWRGGLAAAEYEDRHLVVVITPALQSLKGQHSYLSTGLGFEGEAV